MLAKLTHSLNERDVIVSQDRFTVYRSTVFEDPTIPGESFSTGKKNLHLDLNPWWWEEDAVEIKQGIDTLTYQEAQDYIKENNLVVRSLGRHVQCVLNFANNLEEDGGTLVVPFFHHHMKHWNTQYATLRKPLPWVTLPPKVESEMLQYAHRVTMREGSVLVWDQRVLHGTAPNTSSHCRLAQYLKAYPRHQTFPTTQHTAAPHPRLLRRAQQLEKFLSEDSNGLGLAQVTELGKTLFGLDVLSH